MASRCQGEQKDAAAHWRLARMAAGSHPARLACQGSLSQPSRPEVAWRGLDLFCLFSGFVLRYARMGVIHLSQRVVVHKVFAQIRSGRRPNNHLICFSTCFPNLLCECASLSCLLSLFYCVVFPSQTCVSHLLSYAAFACRLFEFVLICFALLAFLICSPDCQRVCQRSRSH